MNNIYEKEKLKKFCECSKVRVWIKVKIHIQRCIGWSLQWLDALGG